MQVDTLTYFCDIRPNFCIKKQEVININKIKVTWLAEEDQWIYRFQTMNLVKCNVFQFGLVTWKSER